MTYADQLRGRHEPIATSANKFDRPQRTSPRSNKSNGYRPSLGRGRSVELWSVSRFWDGMQTGTSRLLAVPLILCAAVANACGSGAEPMTTTDRAPEASATVTAVPRQGLPDRFPDELIPPDVSSTQ